MPYLPTSQAFLEESSLLLKAYPDTTRITTKYSYPPPSSSSKPKPTSKSSKSKSKSAASTATSTPSTETPPPTTTTPAPATLTLKTFDPNSGICLKYRTNKAAEVGRLISGLGRLASGDAGFEDSTTGAATAGGDVEMGDAPPTPLVAESGGDAGAGGKTGGGGGGKKKKSKGKR